MKEYGMPARINKKSISPKSKKEVSESRTNYQVPSKRKVASRQNLVIKQCKEALTRYYGDRLKRVILYGSMARGQSSLASDIDLLVLLSPPFNYFTELRQLVEILYPIQLDSERLISAKPASVEDFEAGNISLYRNARREGVLVK
jgi:predicted nucleotidyltransferase